MKRVYFTLILLFALVGITWGGMPLGPEQYAPPQDTLMPIEDGLTWAQIFYYSAGGLAGLAVAVKTGMVLVKRFRRKK